MTHLNCQPYPPRCNSAYMSKTNLATHVKQTHKRELRDVLAEKKKIEEGQKVEAEME